MGMLFSVLGMLTTGFGMVANYASADPLYLMIYAGLFGVNFCVFVLNLSDD